MVRISNSNLEHIESTYSGNGAFGTRQSWNVVGTGNILGETTLQNFDKINNLNWKRRFFFGTKSSVVNYRIFDHASTGNTRWNTWNVWDVRELSTSAKLLEKWKCCASTIWSMRKWFKCLNIRELGAIRRSHFPGHNLH